MVTQNLFFSREVKRSEPQAERTGWRDEWISERHRLFGYGSPMVDLDNIETESGSTCEGFRGLEYESGKPVALIEYKKPEAKVDLYHYSYKALKNLADMAGLPSFLVFYYPEHFNYFVIPTNQIAKDLLASVPGFEKPRFWCELAFVKLLYHLRGKNLPQEVSKNLSKAAIPTNILPPKWKE